MLVARKYLVHGHSGCLFLQLLNQGLSNGMPFENFPSVPYQFLSHVMAVATQDIAVFTPLKIFDCCLVNSAFQVSL